MGLRVGFLGAWLTPEGRLVVRKEARFLLETRRAFFQSLPWPFPAAVEAGSFPKSFVASFSGGASVQGASSM